MCGQRGLRPVYGAAEPAATWEAGGVRRQAHLHVTVIIGTALLSGSTAVAGSDASIPTDAAQAAATQRRMQCWMPRWTGPQTQVPTRVPAG
jgi:hypothetical protein